MYITFDKEGVLNIKPENQADVMTLKWFMKEFSAHGGKMINIETELNEDSSKNYETRYPQSYREESYGYNQPQSNRENNYPYGVPESVYGRGGRSTRSERDDMRYPIRDFFDRVGYPNPNDRSR